MKTPTSLAEYRRSVDDLDDAIVGLTAKINATTFELLQLVREFDERAGWMRHGFAHCAEWLAWRCDLGLGAAREKVRVAHALRDLPALSAAFEAGALSYSKVRALTRVATLDNEQALIDFARTTTVAKLEERCRQLRNVQPEATGEANRAYASRSLAIYRNVNRGMITITVELPIEDGELVDQALAQAMERGGAESPELAAESFRARQADALVEIARTSLARSSSGTDGGEAGADSSAAGIADAYQVVVHIDESALRGGEGRSDLPVETVRRLSCDGSLVAMIDSAEGEPLNVGRKQRTVPTAIRRALWARDRGCAFPGCNNKRFVEAHHVMHWAEGGSTSVDNTLLLCGRHHRLVHEGRYEIKTDRHRRWYFQRPDGRVVPRCGYAVGDMADEAVGDPVVVAAAQRRAQSWVQPPR